MRIVSKRDVERPFEAPLGETIFEMIGRPLPLGATTKHSLAHVVIPPGKCSPPHYHKLSEETYYVVSGQGRIVIDGETHTLLPGDACLIMPGESHQIFSDDHELNFLTVSAPAWDASDTYPT